MLVVEGSVTSGVRPAELNFLPTTQALEHENANPINFFLVVPKRNRIIRSMHIAYARHIMNGDIRRKSLNAFYVLLDL